MTEVLYQMAKTKASGTAKDGRTRNWSFVVYPESAPENWRDILDEMHLEWVESPLHDLDVNPTGEVKKAHWHVLLLFEGKKSYEQVKDIIAPLNGTIPVVVQSTRGLVRYMAHLDNPEKAQYSPTDIIGHGGADVAELLKPTSAARYVLIREMMIFVRDSGITEYAQLCEYALENRFDDWYPLLCDSATYVMAAYMKSCRYRAEGNGGTPRDKRSARGGAGEGGTSDG